MKFCTRVRLQRWNDQGEFELDRARSKNNIAENSISLGHETDNKSIAYGPNYFGEVRAISTEDVNRGNRFIEIQYHSQRQKIKTQTTSSYFSLLNGLYISQIINTHIHT